MPGRVYPTVAEAIETHRQLVEEFGGAHGLLDQGRLEAAIFRPQIGYYDTLADEAAALMESLANNNAFLDGNKRIAFVMTDTFLRMNGYFLEVEAEAARAFIEGAMERGEFRFGLIRNWVQGSLKPLQ